MKERVAEKITATKARLQIYKKLTNHQQMIFYLKTETAKKRF